MLGIFITIMDEINVGQWSSGQVGEGKRMCLRWFRSLCRKKRKIFQEQQQDGQAKLKILRSIRRTKMRWESMEKQLNWSGNFPKIFIIVYSSRDPERLG